MNSLEDEELLEILRQFLLPFDPQQTFTFDENQIGDMLEAWVDMFGENFMTQFMKMVDKRAYFRYSQLDKLFSNQIRVDSHYGPFLTHAMFEHFKNAIPTRLNGDKNAFTTDFWVKFNFKWCVVIRIENVPFLGHFDYSEFLF